MNEKIIIDFNLSRVTNEDEVYDVYVSAEKTKIISITSLGVSENMKNVPSISMDINSEIELTKEIIIDIAKLLGVKTEGKSYKINKIESLRFECIFSKTKKTLGL